MKEFDKLPYKSYERRRPKHEPTESYFYPERQIAKCMMRADYLNLHVYPAGMEMTAMKQILISHFCSTNENKLKLFLVTKTLSQTCSTEKEESKCIIFDECPTEEYKSQCVHKNIIKQKDANNDAEYEESSVTHEVLSYFNILKCGRNLLNRIYVTYERACIVIPIDKYYEKMLETLVDYNDHHNATLSNEKL